ncbi:unnamed protein product [Adineta steineri]|uniref:Uncharacterized protein n=1 Tax=Adineta steineri TaxID=433720 RepID=A0A815UDW9_9BILA|nr:unnamed protein product [Adineta steineri]CAF1147179.1 unnamed protein product [Adineta steineri]CAF1516312.1 unnamed protein product [Adineta steineri]CAF4091817.1 unnamed protein product [Adineta steineri]CAF4159934.1 unnamed protein product [Adineta steineri]
MYFDTIFEIQYNCQIFSFCHLAVCADICPSNRTSDITSTCGHTCITDASIGSQHVGSTGTCGINSTYCAGGTYTITRNTYSGVNFDCSAYYGCGSYGCCTGIGPSSSTNVYCIKCN